MNRRDTNKGFRPEDSGSPRQIVRFKVSGTVTDHGETDPRSDLVKAHRFNGTDEGNADYIIATLLPRGGSGGELYAFMPEGGTGVTYAKDVDHPAVPVVWQELRSDEGFWAKITSNTVATG